MKAAFDKRYASRLDGDNVKDCATRWDMVEALREAGFDVMKAENMELLTVRGYTDELWRRYARGPQVFVRQATQSTVRVVRKRS